jgi:hypothetical protein
MADTSSAIFYLTGARRLRRGKLTSREQVEQITSSGQACLFAADIL